MTVAELIKELQGMPQGAEVATYDDNGKLWNSEKVTLVGINIVIE